MSMSLVELFNGLTDSQKQAVTLWVDSGFNLIEPAKELGISKNSFADRIKAVRKKLKSAGYPSTVIEGLHDLCKAMLAEIRQEGTLMASAPFGMTVAKVSQEVTQDGVKRQWVSYQKQKQDVTQANWDALKQDLRESVPKASIKTNQVDSNPNRMAVFVLADVHFGMYAHADETGENSDIKIATQDVLGGIKALVDTTPEAGEAMLLNLGDFFHANSRVPATPASGNILDVDSRFSHVARKGVELMRACVDMIAEKYPKVNIVNVRGNHDPDAAMWLNLVMESHYSECDEVIVHPNERKLLPYQWGDTALFFYHGEKLARAVEYITGHPELKRMHGQSIRSYCLAGHIHHETVKTRSNIRFETFATLAGKDAYHAENLYHAIQNISSIVYDKKYGEVNRSTIPLERIRDNDQG